MRPQDTQMASGREPEPDIVDRLRKWSVFGYGHEASCDMKEAADEIERLRAGGCARDQGTTQYCAEAAEKDAHIRRITLDYLGQIGQLSDEITRLRAALEPLACTCDRPNGAACSRAEVNCAFWNARAALEGK